VSASETIEEEIGGVIGVSQQKHDVHHFRANRPVLPDDDDDISGDDAHDERKRDAHAHGGGSRQTADHGRQNQLPVGGGSPELPYYRPIAEDDDAERNDADGDEVDPRPTTDDVADVTWIQRTRDSPVGHVIDKRREHDENVGVFHERERQQRRAARAGAARRAHAQLPEPPRLRPARSCRRRRAPSGRRWPTSAPVPRASAPAARASCRPAPRGTTPATRTATCRPTDRRPTMPR